MAMADGDGIDYGQLQAIYEDYMMSLSGDRIWKIRVLIAGYLLAIIAANLLVVKLGPVVAIVNALIFIGLDLTTRDYLHEAWSGRKLWLKMLTLIAAGSILSYLLNRNAGPIALASFAAFAGAGVADTVIYWLLGNKSRFLKINGSNVASSAVDSLIFPVLAFGLPVLYWVVLGQLAAKIAGGFVWSLIIRKAERGFV